MSNKLMQELVASAVARAERAERALRRYGQHEFACGHDRDPVPMCVSSTEYLADVYGIMKRAEGKWLEVRDERGELRVCMLVGNPPCTCGLDEILEGCVK